MANTAFDGPLSVYGNLANMPASFAGSPNPDPNQDAGPSKFFQGTAIYDPRILFTKDKITGFTGQEQALYSAPIIQSVHQIPAALAANNIAAAAPVASGVAMTLAAASVGVALNIPIHVFSPVLNAGTIVTAAIALDFGFAWANCTSGSTTVTVANSADFLPGMPLVIAGVGNSAGTAALLTNVVQALSATTIQVTNAPQATNSAAPIGSGDLWGPSEIGFPTPLAAYPFIAGGPGLFLDPRQTISRAVRIVGASGGTGGTFTVAGWDAYGMPMTQLITVAAGANTVYSTKCFKYIGSVTPNFTDGSHNYSVGTGDVFEFLTRCSLVEESTVWWAGALMTGSTGFLVPDTTNPATNATGDVRGTIQTGAAGGGSGIGSTASNGTVSSLAMSGNRLEMRQMISTAAMLLATQANSTTLFGQTQV